MWEGALKCLLQFLLQSEVTKGLNFILHAGASTMATKGLHLSLKILPQRKLLAQMSSLVILPKMYGNNINSLQTSQRKLKEGKHPTSFYKISITITPKTKIL